MKSACPGVRLISAAGYEGCVELANGRTRVVLEPNLGGRVLSYSLDGLEALQQDPQQNGVVWDGTNQPRHPAGGRCDIGPEYGGLARESLWFGRWGAEITGARSARLVSPVLAPSGVQLVREFALHASSSQLHFRQVMRNGGPKPVFLFHWGRTFAPGGGIALAPLPPVGGRFPKGYAVGGPPGTIDFLPADDPAIRVRDGILEVLGPPRRAKLVLDVQPGWLAYLSPAGLLLAKTFTVYPDRAYGEPTANNLSIWYGDRSNTPAWVADPVVELEPIGPAELVPSGGEAAFSEYWHLERWPFPAQGRVDLGAVRAFVEALAPAHRPDLDSDRP